VRAGRHPRTGGREVEASEVTDLKAGCGDVADGVGGGVAAAGQQRPERCIGDLLDPAAAAGVGQGVFEESKCPAGSKHAEQFG
jgi:hypothetical protein